MFHTSQNNILFLFFSLEILYFVSEVKIYIFSLTEFF